MPSPQLRSQPLSAHPPGSHPHLGRSGAGTSICASQPASQLALAACAHPLQPASTLPGSYPRFQPLSVLPPTIYAPNSEPSWVIPSAPRSSCRPTRTRSRTHARARYLRTRGLFKPMRPHPRSPSATRASWQAASSLPAPFTHRIPTPSVVPSPHVGPVPAPRRTHARARTFAPA